MKQHSSPFIVVFDFGTSSGRCLLIDPNGTVLASSQEVWVYQQQKWDGQTLWSFDPVRYWSILATCCQKALTDAGVDPQEARGVIATSQRHGAVLLDFHKQIVEAIPNMDLRSTPEWDEKAGENAPQIYEITGRWPQPVFLPAHLAWMREHAPQKYERVAHILSILDWIVYCLCGEVVSEPTAATDLLLLDVEQRQWCRKLLTLFNIDPQWMPTIVPSGSITGKLNRQAATVTGLPEGIPVLTGGADTQLGVLGLGCTNVNSLAIIMGSSVPLQMVTEKPLRHTAASVWTNPHVIPNQWIVESNAGDAGLHQNNLLEKITEFDSGNRERISDRRKLLVDLDSQIAWRRKTQNNPLLASLGPVIFDGKLWPQVQGMIKGIDINNLIDFDWIDLYQALLDNIAYAIKGNFLQLWGMTGHIDDVRAGGGSMNSSMWQAFLPNVLGTALQVPMEKEVTSLGAALLAFVSLGVHGSFSEGVKEMIRWKTIGGNQKEMAMHDKHYLEWLDLYQLSIR